MCKFLSAAILILLCSLILISKIFFKMCTKKKFSYLVILLLTCCLNFCTQYNSDIRDGNNIYCDFFPNNTGLFTNEKTLRLEFEIIYLINIYNNLGCSQKIPIQSKQTQHACRIEKNCN